MATAGGVVFQGLCIQARKPVTALAVRQQRSKWGVLNGKFDIRCSTRGIHAFELIRTSTQGSDKLWWSNSSRMYDI